MKILMILLPMMLLISGCKTYLICEEIKKSEIKPLVWCDLSFSPKPRCRCRCFDMNENTTMPDSSCSTEEEVFKSGNYPVEECDQIAGPSVQDWVVHVRPKIKRISSLKETYCQQDLPL